MTNNRVVSKNIPTNEIAKKTLLMFPKTNETEQQLDEVLNSCATT